MCWRTVWEVTARPFWLQIFGVRGVNCFKKCVILKHAKAISTHHWSCFIHGMRCCRSDWPGLCLFCYQPSCVVSQQSWFGLFLFHKLSNSPPPPSRSTSYWGNYQHSAVCHPYDASRNPCCRQCWVRPCGGRDKSWPIFLGKSYSKLQDLSQSL